MRRFGAAVLLLTVSVTTTHSQEALTRDQRISDLTQLASIYSKNYAPYEWKRDTQGFDLLRLTPWLHRIRHSDDLDFQEALIEYVASLNDAHDLIAFPTTFSASLPMAVDIYDGKVLIEALNPSVFPGAQRGDELVSIDGRSVQSLIADFRKYAIAANPRSTDRAAATRLVSRSQQIMPHIFEPWRHGERRVRLAATGATNTYVVPWSKIGIPVNSQGPVPSPRRGEGRSCFQSGEQALATAQAGAATASVFQIADLGATDNTLPSYMEPIRALLNASVSKDYFSVSGIGSRFPSTLCLQDSFCVRFRLGCRLSCSAEHTCRTVSGSACCGSRPCRRQAAALVLQHLDQEIAFFNANTDALDHRRDAEPRRPGVVCRGDLAALHAGPVPDDRVRNPRDGGMAVQLRGPAHERQAQPGDPSRRPRESGSELQRGAQGVQRESRPQRARVSQRHGEPHARALACHL